MGFRNMKSKIFSGIFILSVVFITFVQTARAEDIITNRTGTIKIIKPDGTVLTLTRYVQLPVIPSGSIIEVLDGSIDIMPVEGFFQIVAGNTVATVKSGDKVTVSNYSAVCVAEFKVYSGLIETLTVGVKVAVPEGVIAKIGVDVEKRIVHTESREGVIEVTSLQGNIARIDKGQTINTPGISTGKIQTCPVKDTRLPFLLQEEPLEPERPEGSPYRPY